MRPAPARGVANDLVYDKIADMPFPGGVRA